MARRRIGVNDRSRQREHRRAVDQARVVKLGLELTQHRGERRADPLQRRQLVRANSCKADLAQRAGERARKSGTVANRGEIAQRAGRGEFVDRTRGHRLGAQSGSRREAVTKQTLGAEHAEQACGGHPMNAEERAPRAQSAHEVVGGWLARRQHHHLGGWLKLLEPSRGRVETIGRARRAYDCVAWKHRGGRRRSEPRPAVIVCRLSARRKRGGAAS